MMKKKFIFIQFSLLHIFHFTVLSMHTVYKCTLFKKKKEDSHQILEQRIFCIRSVWEKL